MRYFDFIKEIKEISTSHILVNEYGEGDIYEYLNNGEHKYPCIFLTVTNLNTTDSGTAINFTLFYTDRLVENQANKTSIQSTGISVIKQILSKYEQLHPEYLLSNVNYTPFTEKFTDMCAGVFCDVVIENQIETLEDYDNECEEGAFTVKTITLTKNGIYDIVGYDSAIVLVETPMETITITENGVYVPEEGGYNEVIVNVSGGGEKAKVKILDIDNSCIVDGTWNASVIDTSKMTIMSGLFINCSSLQTLDVSNWDTSNVTSMNNMFYGCSSLQTLDVSGWDTSNVTNINSMFYSCKKLTTLIGGRTIDEIISNNISALNGLKININLSSTILDRASLRALINGLADLTGSTSQKLTLGSTLTAKLTEEDIAIATSKNWTIS